MIRYRPPQPATSKHITENGFKVLKEELNFLWRVKRPEVTRAVSEAAALGDRSENAEYIYGKKQLREIDRRVRYLQKRIDDLIVVREPPSDLNKIYFGAWITLEDDAGVEQKVRIVGPDEIDTAKRWISIDSPMAKALLKKAIDEDVVVNGPSGETHYVVTAVKYQE